MGDKETVVIVIGGLLIFSALNELVKIFFARMRTTDFVEKSACKKCQTASNLYDTHQGSKIDAISKLVLAMAIKMGIDVKDIQGIL